MPYVTGLLHAKVVLIPDFTEPSDLIGRSEGSDYAVFSQ